MQTYFSIILPIYNVEKFLHRCVRSILEQSFSDYEVIMVDDGSTDQCAQICDWYAAEFSQIRVVHKTNGGLSSARNAGLEEARGKYVWWVDSDDWIEPGALQRLYDETVKCSPDVVKFNYYRHGKTVNSVDSSVMVGFYEGSEQMDSLARSAFASGGRYVLSAWSSVYCRDMLLKHGMKFVSERQVGSEDYLFNLSLFPCLNSMSVIREALYHYDTREGSLSQRYRENLCSQYSELLSRLSGFYESKGVYDAFRPMICRFYIWHLMMGTYMQHEYNRINERHSVVDARRNVRKLLGSDEFRNALRESDRVGIAKKKQIYLIAMKLRI